MRRTPPSSNVVSQPYSCIERIIYRAYHWLEQTELEQQARLRFDQESRSLPPAHTLHLMMQAMEAWFQDREATPEQAEAYFAAPYEFLGEVPDPETLETPWDVHRRMEECASYRAFHMTRRYARVLLERWSDDCELYRCNALLYLLCASLWLGDWDTAHQTHERLEQELATSAQEQTIDYPTWEIILRELRGLQAKFGLREPAPANASEAAYMPTGGDGFWQTIDPADAGLSADAVAAIHDYERCCKATAADACLVVCRGKIVSEWYSRDYAPPQPVYSCTKSWVSLLAGMLIADGTLGGVDDPVGNYFPEWREGIRGRVTLHHLLTMTSGLMCFEDRFQSLIMAEDTLAFVLAMAPSEEPGTVWSYSNEGVRLFAALLEQAAGMPLREYARRRLFAPLGMDETDMSEDDQGRTNGYGGGTTGLRDFARLGLLLLHGGRWQGQQIMPEEWVYAATHSSPVDAEYGYLFWLSVDPDGYSMLGDNDCECHCFPAQELVVIRLQAKHHLDADPGYSQIAYPLFRRMAAE